MFFHSETLFWERARLYSDLFKKSPYPSEFVPLDDTSLMNLMENPFDRTKKYGKETLNADELGRRITHSAEQRHDSSQKFVAFLGASQVRGYNIADSETFPYIYQGLHSEIEVYNYGISGGSLILTLLSLEQKRMTFDLAQRRGCFILVLDVTMLRRTVAAPENSHWLSQPYLVFRDNKYGFKGEFRNNHPYEWLTMELYRTSMFNVLFPRLADDLYPLQKEKSRIVVHLLQKLIRNQFSKAKVLYFSLDREAHDFFDEFMNIPRDEVLDFSKIWRDELVQRNGHFNKSGNTTIAKFFDQHLDVKTCRYH